MNNKLVIGLIWAFLGQATSLHASQIYRPPEPFPLEKANELESNLRKILSHAGSENDSLRDMPVEFFFPTDAPREIHVANVMKIANEFLEETNSRKAANSNAGDVSRQDYPLLMLMNIMGDLKHREFLPWLEQRAESPWSALRGRASINYVKIAGLDAVEFLRKCVVAHPDECFLAVEEFLHQVDLETTIEPKINSAYVFLLDFIQLTKSSGEAHQVDNFLNRHISECSNSLQRAEMARQFYNNRNVSVINIYDPIKERFDRLPYAQRVDMRHRFPSLPVIDKKRKKTTDISTSPTANAESKYVSNKTIPPNPVPRLRTVNPIPATNIPTKLVSTDPNVQLRCLREVIEKTLDVSPGDFSIATLDAFVVTNNIPDNLLVSTVKLVAEEKLQESGARGGGSEKNANIWLLITQLGNKDFLPFLDEQSRSVYDENRHPAADTYVRLEGLDASFFLRKKFINSRRSVSHGVWWNSTQKVFFEAIKQAEQQKLTLAKINTAYMVLVEHAMQTENLNEADFLDNWLCNNLPEYSSSIQRKRTINRLAGYPDKLVTNPFLSKKKEFDVRFPGKYAELEKRFSWLSRLRDIEYRPFMKIENCVALKKELLQAKEQGRPWHEVVIPNIQIKGDEDVFSLVERIKNVLSESYDFKVHWQAPKPIEMFFAIEAKSIPTGSCLSLILDLFDLFWFQTDNALFVFDHRERWEEDAILVIRGKVIIPTQYATPQRLRVRKWIDYSGDPSNEKPILPEVASVLQENGEYICWYPYRRTLDGISFPPKQVRISRDRAFFDTPVDKLRFEIDELPPLEYELTPNIMKPFQTLNLRYDGSQWIVEIDEKEGGKGK